MFLRGVKKQEKTFQDVMVVVGRHFYSSVRNIISPMCLVMGSPSGDFPFLPLTYQRKEAAAFSRVIDRHIGGRDERSRRKGNSTADHPSMVKVNTVSLLN